MVHIPGEKTAICTKCTYPHGKTKEKDCNVCRKKNCVHLFDSAGEANRYLFLKNNKNISDLIIQPHFDLFSAQLPYAESWAGKTPTLNIKPKEKFKLAKIGNYKADFQYYDAKTQGGWVIEDFKAYNRKTKTPIISDYVRFRLNLLHKQCGHKFKIIISTYTGREYITQEIKPKAQK